MGVDGFDSGGLYNRWEAADFLGMDYEEFVKLRKGRRGPASIKVEGRTYFRGGDLVKWDQARPEDERSTWFTSWTEKGYVVLRPRFASSPVSKLPRVDPIVAIRLAGDLLQLADDALLYRERQEQKAKKKSKPKLKVVKSA